jgi:pyruvate/2-oxoglutarate dehydrogenase complex dihydrolipoamide acyltransferase (E2) component
MLQAPGADSRGAPRRQRLLESKRTVPHLYVRKDARLATVTSLRAALKEAGRKARWHHPA